MNATIELIDLYKGESDYRTFTYKINGVPVNLNTLSDIRILLLDDKTKAVILKYSKVASTGWNSTDFVIVDAANGIFGYKMQSVDSDKFNIGVARIEFEISKTLSGFSPKYDSIYAERIYNVLPSKIAAL